MVVGSGTAVGILKRRRVSSQTGTIRVWILKRELWHRLENKPERAYRASGSFVSALRWGLRGFDRRLGGCSGSLLMRLYDLPFHMLLKASNRGVLSFKSGYSLQD